MLLSINRQLRELDAFVSRGASVLTIYVNTGPGRNPDDVQEAVERLVLPLSRRLSQAERTDLLLEVAVIRDYLGSLICPPPALALFSCVRRRFFRVVRLPVEVAPAAFWSQRGETALLHAVAERVNEPCAQTQALPQVEMVAAS